MLGVKSLRQADAVPHVLIVDVCEIVELFRSGALQICVVFAALDHGDLTLERLPHVEVYDVVLRKVVDAGEIVAEAGGGMFGDRGVFKRPARPVLRLLHVIARNDGENVYGVGVFAAAARPCAENGMRMVEGGFLREGDF